MRKLSLVLWLLPAVCGGCAGQYILTVPDQVAPAGGQAVCVIRVQRAEVALLALPVPDAAMRLRVDDGDERGAYTDALGYAGTTVRVPATPGRYTLRVALQDPRGDEAHASAPLYVWEPNRPAFAVDLDSLPPALMKDAATAAKAALLRLASEGDILYMTRRAVEEHPAAHQELARAGFPDGPVLLWQRERWHVVRENQWSIPRVVVESRLVNQIAGLRTMFPGLQTGVTSSDLSAKAFAEAGLKVVLIGPAAAVGPNVVRRADWNDLARQGP